MKKINCSCGNSNPYGTELCVACGRILKENDTEKVDMRYEGSARRSQTYKKNLIDKVWNFFSSVKIGVSFIIILLLASIVGTILPQESYIPPGIPANDYYKDTYGWFGSAYYYIGFANLYQSWWYLLLIFCLSFSLIIASFDRFFPLYRALKNQHVKKHPSFYYNQRIFFRIPVSADNQLEEKLRQLRYHVKKDKQYVLAEKGRFSRWGPYINHAGLILFLFGAMLRFVPGLYVNEVMWIRDGQTKQIPGTDGLYYLKNNIFKIEVYDKKKENKVFQKALENRKVMAKNFQTNVTLFQSDSNAVAGEKTELKKIKDANIKVNEPLQFNEYAIYQGDYKLNEFSHVRFAITDNESKRKLGDIQIHLDNPESSIPLNKDIKIKLLEYYPDVSLNEDGKPSTKSKIPNNPAFILEISHKNNQNKERFFATLNQTIASSKNNKWNIKLEDVHTRNVSALTVRKDPMLPILFAGGIIFMIGVIQGSYWNHRRIWLQKHGNEIRVAAHTNKNWFALKRELSFLFAYKSDELMEKNINDQKILSRQEERADGKHKQ
ncbi:cytochrome c biogenesis protein ResB [Niallia sp. 03133]|uniref:cytochrome c biogenesis protein ResB n=1 Tax=Niallia sp. 03133 TaxID=3458060 RepID=UPI0040442AD4